MTTWAIDLDGVMWRGDVAIPGAPEAVASLLDHGDRVVFCTNHAMAPKYKRQVLDSMGVPDAPVVTAAQSAAAVCTPGSPVLVLGDTSLTEVLRQEGLDALDAASLGDGPAPRVDAVIVGATTHWDRSTVGLAADAIRDGARFVATNDDATFPTSASYGTRLLPGNGAMVAAVATASGRAAEISGKPHAPMAALLESRFGRIDVVVGDKPETDGALAERLGARFALVLSGVTHPSHLPVEPTPWVVGVDLAAVVGEHTAAGGS